MRVTFNIHKVENELHCRNWEILIHNSLENNAITK